MENRKEMINYIHTTLRMEKFINFLLLIYHSIPFLKSIAVSCLGILWKSLLFSALNSFLITFVFFLTVSTAPVGSWNILELPYFLSVEIIIN